MQASRPGGSTAERNRTECVDVRRRQRRCGKSFIEQADCAGARSIVRCALCHSAASARSGIGPSSTWHRQLLSATAGLRHAAAQWPGRMHACADKTDASRQSSGRLRCGARCHAAKRAADHADARARATAAATHRRTRWRCSRRPCDSLGAPRSCSRSFLGATGSEDCSTTPSAGSDLFADRSGVDSAVYIWGYRSCRSPGLALAAVNRSQAPAAPAPGTRAVHAGHRLRSRSGDIIDMFAVDRGLEGEPYDVPVRTPGCMRSSISSPISERRARSSKASKPRSTTIRRRLGFRSMPADGWDGWSIRRCDATRCAHGSGLRADPSGRVWTLPRVQGAASHLRGRRWLRQCALWCRGDGRGSPAIGWLRIRAGPRTRSAAPSPSASGTGAASPAGDHVNHSNTTRPRSTTSIATCRKPRAPRQLQAALIRASP